MSFIVRARTSNREIVSQHVSMLGALERALILAGTGMTGVVVNDHHGRSFSPAELSRQLFGAHRNAPAGEPVHTAKREAA